MKTISCLQEDCSPLGLTTIKANIDSMTIAFGLTASGKFLRRWFKKLIIFLPHEIFLLFSNYCMDNIHGNSLPVNLCTL